jgi:dihydropteroate synthase
MIRLLDNITIVGIVNCTPDSFSDGSAHCSVKSLCDHGEALVAAGAEMLDIGGDSTRPGSVCCGIEDEWQRIAPVLLHFAHRLPCSVDTHHAEIARRAVAEGAAMINDITAGHDPEMLSVVVSANVQFVAMFNPHGAAHVFGKGVEPQHVVSAINSWGALIKQRYQAAGGAQEKLILDTGMGAFVAHNPDVSREIVRRYAEVSWSVGGAMFGCSRKGFLRTPGEQQPADRDALSALCGVLVASKLPAGVPLYLRVHNVELQKAALDLWALQ